MTFLNPLLAGVPTVTSIGTTDLVLSITSTGTFQWVSGANLVASLGQSAAGLPGALSLSSSMTVTLNDGVNDTKATLSALSAFLGTGTGQPALAISSVSPVIAAGTSTANGTFSNGAPTALTGTIDGASVTLGTPTITTASGTANSGSGTFSVTFTAPAAGSHTLTLAGTGTYAGTSNTLAFTTTSAGAPSLTLNTPASSTAGSVLAITGSFANGTPNGFTFAIDAGGTSTASNPVISGGTWSFNITAPAVGSHTITVTGTGGNTASATSSSFTNTAAGGGFAISTVAPASIGIAGASMTFNVVMSGGSLSTTGLTVLVNGTSVTPISASGTSIVITAPASTAGNTHTGFHTISVQGSAGSPQSSSFATQATATAPFTLQMSPTYGLGWFSANTPATTGLNYQAEFNFVVTPAAPGAMSYPGTYAGYGPTSPSPAPGKINFIWGSSATVPPTLGNSGGSGTSTGGAWGIGYSTDNAVSSYNGGNYSRLTAPLGSSGGGVAPSGNYYAWITVKMADGTFYTYVGTSVVSP